MIDWLLILYLYFGYGGIALDVHPPLEPVHTWSGFFIHLITITIGLLIALGLEGLAEAAHNRHLMHRAESNLRSELRSNRSTLTADEKDLERAEKQIGDDLKLLVNLKAGQKPWDKLVFHWEWDDLHSAAWDTARNTNAVALMRYEAAEEYSDIYAQQSIVNEQAAVYTRDVYHSAAPLLGGRETGDLKPSEVDAIAASLQQSLADIKYLRDLCESLERLYDKAARDS